MKVPGSKIVPCPGALGSNHSLTFGLFTQVSGSGPLGPLVYGNCYFEAKTVFVLNHFTVSKLLLDICSWCLKIAVQLISILFYSVKKVVLK